MKKLLLIAVTALISISAKAQEKIGFPVDTIPVIDGVYQFQEVVKVDSMLKKDQLYKNAKTYFMDVFAGAKDAFQYDDKEEGKIIGKGFMSVSDYKTTFPAVAVLKWDVYYNLEVSCKDGKYMYRFYDILVTREGRVAENNYWNVHLTVQDIYDGLLRQKGAYKTVYPKVINKMIAEIKTDMVVLKENMVKKQPKYSAAF